MKRIFTALLLAVLGAGVPRGPLSAQVRSGTWRLVDVRNDGFQGNVPSTQGYYLHVEGESRSGEVITRYILNPNEESPSVVTAATRWIPPPQAAAAGSPFRLNLRSEGQGPDIEQVLTLVFQSEVGANPDNYRTVEGRELEVLRSDAGSWPATPDPGAFPFLEVGVVARSNYTTRLTSFVGTTITVTGGGGD